jgi:hypothetical protein
MLKPEQTRTFHVRPRIYTIYYGHLDRYGRLEVIQELYDAAVSGADPIDARTAFTDMMAFCGNGGPKVVLVENASRFARDLIVQARKHAKGGPYGR